MSNTCPECGNTIYPWDSGCWECTGELNVPKEIIEIAKRVIEKQKKNWPEDDWYSLTGEWDLNLFSTLFFGEDVSEEKVAIIYPVKDGMVKTNRYKRIDIE